jgi:hypothetical protein
MELRKCLCHPYLVAAELEPTDVTVTQEHDNLVQASAKLSLLQRILQKLRANGNRVLIFSQFKIVLDILETFFEGEKIKYLRLVNCLQFSSFHSHSVWPSRMEILHKSKDRGELMPLTNQIHLILLISFQLEPEGLVLIWPGNLHPYSCLTARFMLLPALTLS